ncbi:MAG: translocation/assembly module TamB domain-containing protein [Pseudomonadota bacterium]
MARSFVVNQIESANSSEQSIEIEGLRGDMLGRFSVDRITLADAEGIWLSIDDLDLAWAPLALISGEMRLKTLDVREINMRRQPSFQPSDRQTQSPFLDRYRIEALQIDRVILANGIVGPAQAYTLSGTLDATNSMGEVILNLQPIVAVGDTLRVDLRWGGEIPLQGEMTLDGAPSGLFATLLDVPPGLPLTATLTASGDLTEWDLIANATVGEAEALELRASRSGDAYQSAGMLLLSPFGRLAPFEDRIGPRISGSFERDADGLLFANLQSDHGGFAGQGRLVEVEGLTRVEDFVLAISNLDAAAVTKLETIELSAARAEGVLELEAQTVRFFGDLSVPSAVYQGYSVEGFVSRGEHAWRANGVELDVALQAERPGGLPKAVSDRLAAEIASDLSARFDLDTRRIEIDAATLLSGDTTAQASGTYDFDGRIDLAGSARLTGVAPIDALTGTWQLAGTSFADIDLAFNGRAMLSETETTLTQLIGEMLDLDLAINRTPQRVELAAFSAQSEQIQTSASGQLTGDQIDLRGTIDLPAAELANLSASGVTSRFSLSGPIATPRFESDVLAETVIAGGERVSDVFLRANGVLGSLPSFDLDLDSTYRDAPLTARAVGALGAGRVEVETLNVIWAELLAEGAAQIDLSDLQNSTLALTTSGQAPLVRQIDGQIRYAESALEADISLAEAALGGVELRSADLKATGTWPLFSGDVSFAGDIPFWAGTEPLTGDHQWTLDAVQRSVELNGVADLAGQTLEITSPVELRFADSFQAVGTLAAFGGAIEIQMDNSGRTPSRLNLTEVKMRRLGTLIQRPGLRGIVSGTAELVIVEKGLAGQGDFQIRQLGRGDSARADVDLQAVISGDALSATLSARDDEDDLSLSAQAETRLQHAGTLASIRPVTNALVPVQVEGSGPIAPLWALAAPSDLRLDGVFELNLSNGDGRAFRFAGPAAIRDGVFEDGFTGLHLEDINAEADLTEDAIRVREATARGGNSGTLSASGAYRFDGDSDVTMVLNRLDALNRSDVSAEISGQASLDRRQRRTHIEGDLRLDEARINLSKLPGAGYTTLDVVFADPGGSREPDIPAREAISLNLNVNADRRVFVTGPGVESEWGLAARITGSPGAPQVNGRATLVRGEADLLSRSFRLTEGIVRFAGDPQDSEVALRADRTNDGITTSINLVGTVTDLEISLSSDPSLPNDEILARVLFGRSPSNLSPLQAAQLAAAAAQLAGGDAISLTGQLEEATGLDRLDFGFDEDGEATLSTGKYLADDLYLEVESGGSGAPGVALEWTPLANVELDAEIDPELGPKVAIQWKRDFDRLPGEAAPEPPARPSGNE